MDINSIYRAFSLPLRLQLISCLVQEEKSFNELKEITKASDGNLSVQLSKLESLNLIVSKKISTKKREITVYKITELGCEALQQYVELLENVIISVKNNI